MALIATGDIKLRYSGGAANDDPTASHGGAISSESADEWNFLRNCEEGSTYYRCIYVLNTSTNAYGLQDAVFRLVESLPAGVDAYIALGNASKNGTETATADQFTAPTGPSFGTGDVTLPDLDQDEYQAVWVKFVVTSVPSASGYIDPDDFKFRVIGTTHDTPVAYGYGGVETGQGVLYANYQYGQAVGLAAGGGGDYRLFNIKAYLDGAGGGTGTQVFTGVVYDDDTGYPGDLIEASDEQSVTNGDGAAWKTFNLAGTVDVPADAVYWIDLHCGTVDQVARYYRSANGSWYNVVGISDTYSDGPEDPCPAGGSGGNNRVSITMDAAQLVEITATPLSIETWIDAEAPSESTLDVIRFFDSMDRTDVTDITSATAMSYSDVRITQVLNQPGSLEFTLHGCTIKQLHTWLDEYQAVEYWRGGVRKGCYLIDDYTPDWANATVRVRCIGALAMANWDVVPAGKATNSPSALIGALGDAVLAAATGLAWRIDGNLLDGLSAVVAQYADGEGQYWMDWIRTLLPGWGDHGQYLYIDADWYLHAEDLKDPSADAADVTYTLNTDTYQFQATFSARDIKNYVKILAPNAAAPFYVICQDATSQSNYGYRRLPDVQYDEATTLAAATTFGNNLLAAQANPKLDMSVSTDHDEDVYPGLLGEVDGLDDGRDYLGIIRQISWEQGSDYDQVYLSYQPITMPDVILEGYTRLGTAISRLAI